MHRHDWTYIDARTIRCDVCGAEKEINGDEPSIMEYVVIGLTIFGVVSGIFVLLVMGLL